MTYQVIPYVGRLSYTLTPQTGTQIIEIYKCPRCGPALAKIDKDQNPIISINGFLKNFDAKTFIYSLPEKAPPVPSLTDSEYESLIKAVEYERSAPKIRLNIWTKRRGGSWDKVGVGSVTNPNGFEWQQLTLLDYLTPNLSAEFGEGDSLGISLEDAGNGLLKSGDRIVIAGSFVEEIACFSPSTITNNITNSESTNTAPAMEPPIGSIIAWHKNFAVVELPIGWQECSGQTITDPESPYNGLIMPNLNNEKLFLRGSGISGGVQDDAMQGHWHNTLFYDGLLSGSGTSYAVGYRGKTQGRTEDINNWGAGNPTSDGSNGIPRIASETRPKNMSVVWIMRIK